MNIEESSQVELEAMLAYIGARQSDRPPVPIGGWAVYAHCGPTYLKSIDIDFVLRSRDRDSLIHWLVKKRGFGRTHVMSDGWKGARKPVPTLGQDIVLDTASYDMPNRFHDRPDGVPFAWVAAHHEWTYAYGVPVRIPTRSLLLLFKAKAAFDRAARLADGDSHDTPYTAAKLVKDRADIAALLQHRSDWELGFLHGQFTRCPFLVDVLEDAVRDPSGLDRGGLDAGTARAALAHLRDQASF